jgi:thymidylate synthase (FAD)
MKQSDIQVTAIKPERWGDDLDVVNAARVSFNKVSEEFTAKDEKLINYLAKHKHFSPFNHSFITLRVKAPIFVARQLVKHKFMPWNEVSRRYVDDEPEFYIPRHQWRLRAENVKQGSANKYVDEDTSVYVQVDVETSVEIALNTYQFMLKQGVCAEQARMVLPQNMMTEWIWSGTLGAYCDMLRLRLDPHTQYESRIVAQKARALIEPIFPVSVKALLDD